MNNFSKLALAATAASVWAGSTQAQLVSGFTQNKDQLLLGFTAAGSTGDLVINLGTVSQVGVGSGLTLNLNDNGNVGLTPAGLSAELTSLYGGLGGLSFGVVGGHQVNQNNNAIYATVLDGSPAPVLGAVGTLNSAANTVGQGVNDFQGSPANQGVVDPTQGYGESWTEEIGNPTSLWQKNGTSPLAITPAGFGPDQTVVLDLYGKVNGVETMEGKIIFGGDGTVVSTVPEPGVLSLACLGLALVALRRRVSTSPK